MAEGETERNERPPGTNGFQRHDSGTSATGDAGVLSDEWIAEFVKGQWRVRCGSFIVRLSPPHCRRTADRGYAEQMAKALSRLYGPCKDGVALSDLPK